MFGKERIRGVGIGSGSPLLAELAVRVGLDTVWIDMEHGATGYETAQAMCQAAEAAGGFGTIRVADARRANVLRALEVGARIVVVPMIDTAAQAADVVRAGKFPPDGERGYNTRARGVAFGLGPTKDAFARANAETHLLAQIESKAAVENVEEICAVPGLSGILVGPGDLSASLGCLGDMKNAELEEAVTTAIGSARAAGKHAGIYVSPGPLLEAAIAAGADVVFSGNDVGTLIEGWKRLVAPPT